MSKKLINDKVVGGGLNEKGWKREEIHGRCLWKRKIIQSIADPIWCEKKSEMEKKKN